VLINGDMMAKSKFKTSKRRMKQIKQIREHREMFNDLKPDLIKLEKAFPNKEDREHYLETLIKELEC
jgi:hypothetical protein